MGSTTSLLGAAALCLLPLGTSGAGAPPCAGVAPTGSTSLTAVRVAQFLPNDPLGVTAPAGDAERLFIVERTGTIRVRHRGAATTAWTTFLDISARVNSETGGEMGLLGMAFAPDYADSGHFYVNYTEGPQDFTGPWFTVVARFSVSEADPDLADPDSEVRILRFLQPQGNHNGGQLLFGPDGFLWIPTGDGGAGNDEGPGHAACGNGQSLATPLGKILRVDVTGGAGSAPDCGLVGLPGPGNYTVPTDNPFADGVGGTACDEIWGLGLRNPWRNAFDAATGDLYVADVGQACWEEINVVAAADAAGVNFGWRQMEGGHCHNPSAVGSCDPPGQACGLSPACGSPALTPPVHEYCQNVGACPGAEGCAVTGGVVYRGCLMPNLAGTYFYGDFCAGFVRSFRMANGVPAEHTDWTPDLAPDGSLAFGLVSFGEDAQGEIYIVSMAGDVFKVLPALVDVEVSGPGSAQPLALSPDVWTWEDLHRATEHDVAFYRVYRGVPGDNYQCVHTTPEPRWEAGADPAVPETGQLFAYVVTAVGPDGVESSPGTSGFFDNTVCP